MASVPLDDRCSESPATDGMLTDELLARAVNEIAEAQRWLRENGSMEEWASVEERLDNALRDVGVARHRFKVALT